MPRPDRSVLQRRRALLAADTVDERRMREAIELARRCYGLDEVPIAATVYRHGRPIAWAINTREKLKSPTGHAEMLALERAADFVGDWRLADCVMYVTLEPCVMCAAALVNARMGRLVYGAASPKSGAVASLYQLCTDPRLNHRVDVTGGVLANECGTLLTEFFRRRRRAAKRANH